MKIITKQADFCGYAILRVYQTNSKSVRRIYCRKRGHMVSEKVCKNCRLVIKNEETED